MTVAFLFILVCNIYVYANQLQNKKRTYKSCLLYYVWNVKPLQPTIMERKIHRAFILLITAVKWFMILILQLLRPKVVSVHSQAGTRSAAARTRMMWAKRSRPVDLAPRTIRTSLRRRATRPANNTWRLGAIRVILWSSYRNVAPRPLPVSNPTLPCHPAVPMFIFFNVRFLFINIFFPSFDCCYIFTGDLSSIQYRYAPATDRTRFHGYSFSIFQF